MRHFQISAYLGEPNGGPSRPPLDSLGLETHDKQLSLLLLGV